MAVLAFGIYLAGFCLVGALFEKPNTPRRNCNDSDRPLWPVK